MELKNYFVQDDQGNKLPGATCYLYERGTENLITNVIGATGWGLSNPFKSDENGLVQFAAANGIYDLRVQAETRDYRIPMQLNDVSETLAAAQVAAVRAEVAADISATASNQCSTIEEGLQKTSGSGTDNRFFSVVSEGNSVVTWYRNDAGVATKVNEMASRTGVLEAVDAVSTGIGVVLDPIAASIKRQDTSRSGWIGAETDKLKRMLSAIKISTGWRHHFITQVFESAISVSKVIYNGQSVSYKRMAPRSGWLWGRLDKFNRVYFGQKVDGSIWAWGKKLLSSTDRAELEALILSQVPAPASSQVFQSKDKDGKQQIYIRDLVTGGIRQLSSPGSNNIGPQMSADGLNVMYTSDRTEGLGPSRLAVAVAGGIERLVTPRLGRLTAIGDSLTSAMNEETSGILSWPTRVGSTQGWTITNRAIPSYTSSGEAALVGAIPTTVNATGNSIGGAGAVTVLPAVSPPLLSVHNGQPTDGATRTVTGTLAGIHGTLRRRPSWTDSFYVDVYEFISDAGTATTACPSGSIFYPDVGDQANEVLSICLGTNRGVQIVESDDVVKANVAAIIKWAAPLYPKILLFGLPSSASSLNAYWRTTFPQYYVLDSAGRDLNQRLRASGDGSAKDLEYLAAGRLPYSLLLSPDTGDYTHVNAAGNAIWAQFANECIQARGYSL